MRSTWTAPELQEINLGSEIGTYYEDGEDPSFLLSGSTRDLPRRRSGEPRSQAESKPAR